MTDQERIAKLERELEAHLGLISGLTTIVGVLIASHQDKQALAMSAAILIEQADANSLGQALPERSRHIARHTAESLLRMPAEPGPKRPRR